MFQTEKALNLIVLSVTQGFQNLIKFSSITSKNIPKQITSEYQINNRHEYASEAISLGFILVLDLHKYMDVTKRS